MAPKKAPRPGTSVRAPTDREFTEAFVNPSETDYRTDYDNYDPTEIPEMSPEEILEYNKGDQSD